MYKVSVIISSFNHAPFIEKSVQSVLDQTFQDFEILVADDASTDNTLEVLKSFDDPRIQVFSFSENRKEHMKNYCLERAKGDYVAILNSDDYMAPERLERQVAFMESNQNFIAVFTDRIYVDRENNFLSTSTTENRSRHKWLWYFLTKDNGLVHSSAMIRRSFFKSFGHYNRWLLLASDLDMWIRICLKGEIQVLNEPLTYIRTFSNEENLSGNRPQIKNRKAFEFQIIYRHFFDPEALTQLPEIFPEETVPNTQTGRQYFLAKHLAKHHLPTVRLYGNQKLYELMNDSKRKDHSRIENTKYPTNQDFYQTIAETNYDPVQQPLFRVRYKNITTKEIQKEISFYSKFNKRVEILLEIESIENTQFAIIPCDYPCLIQIDYLGIVSPTKIDLINEIKVRGTAVKIDKGSIANLGILPILGIPSKYLKGKKNITLMLRMILAKNMKPLLDQLRAEKDRQHRSKFVS